MLSDAAPLLVRNFEDFRHHFPGKFVSFVADGAHILVFKQRSTGFQLLYEHQHGLQDVDRLKSSDDDRDLKFAN